MTGNSSPNNSRSARDLDAESLLPGCRWEAFRASGPGGQKRNKTSSAIRITHIATGLCAIANESRSQSANRQKAMQRLLHRIAIEIREPIDPQAFTPPEWLAGLAPGGRLSVSARHPDYLKTIGLVLDVLQAVGWSVSDAAALLGMTTGNLVAFLREDEHAWTQTNRSRAAAGLRQLNG